jgi:hypothetical protein
MGSTDAAARPGLGEATHPETEPPLLKWRPHARSRRNRVASDRLRVAFMYEKGGKGPGFRDSTGEYRDTRTGWLGREVPWRGSHFSDFSQFIDEIGNNLAVEKRCHTIAPIDCSILPVLTIL